jgi:hypothetical protein
MSANGRKPGVFAENVKALALAAERFFAGQCERLASPVACPLNEGEWLKLQRRPLEHHLSRFGA